MKTKKDYKKGHERFQRLSKEEKKRQYGLKPYKNFTNEVPKWV